MINFDVAGIASSAVLIVPIIVALVQVVKMTGIDSRWSPIFAIFFGLFFSMLVNGSFYTGGHFVANSILAGVIYGLSACGLYSGAGALKSTLEEKQNNNNDPTPPPTTGGVQ